MSKKYMVEIEVDPDIVKKAADMNDIKKAIWNELGWVAESGIIVIDIKEMEV